jgi:uridine kinase
VNDVIQAIRISRPPEGVKTRIVAVDGLGGAGKSSLARWLAPRLDAEIVPTDDFASWDDPVDWWAQLLELVLKPLAAGDRASYQPTSWDGNEREPVGVEPSGTVILEGVTSSRQLFRPYLAYSIWVATPREVRLQRGLERDGADAMTHWKRWMEAEDQYIERERPEERADLVIRGDKNLWATYPSAGPACGYAP